MKYYRYLQPSSHAPLPRTDLRSPLAIPANQNRSTNAMSELSRFESACPTIKISAIDILTFPSTPWLLLHFAAILGMVLAYYASKPHHITTRGLLSPRTTARMRVCVHRTRSIV